MTPRERAERLIDLRGEIKLADQLIAECVRDEAEMARRHDLAAAAVITQRDRRAALYAEARRLGEEAKADFDALVPVEAESDGLREARLGIGEHHVPLADESADAPRVECEVIGVIPPNAPPTIRVDLWAEGDALRTDRIDEAFDRATHPQDDTGHENGRAPWNS